MANPSGITYTDAQLIDSTIAQINALLESNLSWLDNTYGKAQKLTRIDNGREYHYPAIWVSGETERDYLKMFPDSNLGNFCFWDVKDGEVFDKWYPGEYQTIHAEFGCVFWFDLRDIYPDDYEMRTIENVKRDILDVFAGIGVTGGQFRLTKIFHQAKNIYPEYNHREIQNQFLMRPFGGLRFSGDIKIRAACPT